MKITFILFYCLLFNFCEAQKVIKFSFYNKDWQVVSNYKKAIFFSNIVKQSKEMYVHNYYYMDGPAIKIETYKNKEATIKNGFWGWYKNDGNIDSGGYYNNSQKISKWVYVNDDTVFKNVEKIIYLNKPNNTFDSTNLVNIKKDKNLLFMESKFKGNLSQFLDNHLQYPQYAQIKKIEGLCKLQFTISKDSEIEEIILLKSIEYNLDNEVQRVIKKSIGKWIAEIENGKNVKSTHTIEIKF